MSQQVKIKYILMQEGFDNPIHVYPGDTIEDREFVEKLLSIRNGRFKGNYFLEKYVQDLNYSVDVPEQLS